MVKSGASETRDRLIDATLELVAERGFAGVSVGDIEAGAGLAPRSGALYKYFESKLAVLEAGLERHLASIADVEIDLSASPLTEPASEIEAVVHWLLAELDRERTITHVIEREGDRLPELRDRMRAGVSDRGYRVAASLIERWAASITDQRIDDEALAVLLIGGLINLRRSTWTFGAPPLGLSDERFVDTFVALSTTLLNIDPNRQNA
jgi:AcrR family transcriptional regulator